jgi:hypothetical protein
MDENTPSDDIDCGAEDPTAPELQGGTKHTPMIFINFFGDLYGQDEKSLKCLCMCTAT